MVSEQHGGWQGFVGLTRTCLVVPKTDGVVEGTSQVYPNAIRNVSARRPTSHAGETRTRGSADEVRDIMAADLQIPRWLQ